MSVGLANEVATHGVGSRRGVLVAFLLALAIGAIVSTDNTKTIGPKVSVMGVAIMIVTIGVAEFLFQVTDFCECFSKLLADCGVSGDKGTE